VLLGDSKSEKTSSRGKLYLEDEIPQRNEFSRITVGEKDASCGVCEARETVAPTDSPVLITSPGYRKGERN